MLEPIELFIIGLAIFDVLAIAIIIKKETKLFTNTKHGE